MSIVIAEDSADMARQLIDLLDDHPGDDTLVHFAAEVLAIIITNIETP